MKLWVVGKNGLVAKTLTHYLTEDNIPFLVTSRKEVDVTDPNQIERFLDRSHPTHIINCAALSKVDEAEEKQEEALALNSYAPQHLAKAAARTGAKLIHLSTDYLFSGSKSSPYKEEDIPDPINFYGKSKLLGEQLIEKENSSFLIVRTARIFGTFAENPASRMIRLLQTKEKLFVSEQEVRTPTCARDLVHTLVQWLDKEGIVHFANGEGVSRLDWIKYLYTFLQKEGMDLLCKEIIPCKEFPSVAKRPPYCALDCSKAEKWLESPIAPWQEKIEEYLQRVYLNESAQRK